MRGFIQEEQIIPFLKDGLTLMVGGFLANGSPEELISIVIESNVKDLTIVCNDGGFVVKGCGRVIALGRVKKLIASHIGTNPEVGRLMNEGSLEVELVPQGTLAERIRAHGAGLGGILTPTGLKTVVDKGKQIITLNGIEYLLEEPIKADIALLGGAIGDEFGNLRYRGTMRNFNPIMAMAADLTIAEVSKVEKELDPEMVITPHPLVDYILVGGHHHG